MYTDAVIEAICQVSGTVQGVGFRDFVVTEAKACTVFGWVKNEADGSVCVCAQGTPDAIKAFIEALHEGSVLASVTGVSVEWQTPEELFSDFHVIY